MIDDNLFIKLIDKHINNHIGFAICRLPNRNDDILIIQNQGQLQCFNKLSDIDNLKGFVMTPFDVNELPITIIQPQTFAVGRENITKVLNSLETKELNHNSLSQTYDVTFDEYKHTFDNFVDAIKKGIASKIVLSRCSKISISRSPANLYTEACKCYPHLMIYLAYTPITGMWLGCTPEILIEGNSNRWHTIALAGTQLYSDNIVWDSKNKNEQHIVEEYITNVIKPITNDTTTMGPYTFQAAHLAHLCTDIQFSTKNKIGAGTIAQILHPTPAICGMPQHSAYDLIKKNELTKRLYYSGIIGLINILNNNNLYVNIRCIRIENNEASIFAGGGIMIDSDCQSEWNETEIKISTICKLTQ